MTMTAIPHFYFQQVDWAFSHACSLEGCAHGSISVGTEHTVIIDVGRPLGHDLPIQRFHTGCAPVHPTDPDEHLEPGLGMEAS